MRLYPPAPMRPVLLGLLLAAPLAAAAPRVVIDPGHGGHQEGAKGVALAEKDLALQLAQRLARELEGSAEVTLTREDDRDLTLSQRVELANQRRADVFISLHANSMPTRKTRARTHGIETYFLSASASGEGARRTAAKENDEAPQAARRAQGDTLSFILADLQRQGAHSDSSRLAYAVHQRLIRATRAEDRGVQQAPFFVLTGVQAPAILVEVGYITHPQEGRRLASAKYQAALARALAEGVKAFLAEVAAREARGGPVAGSSAP